MADLSHLIAVETAANALLDVTGGGMPAGKAGAYSLNICNDTDAEIQMSAVQVTDGGAPTDAHKCHPAFTIEPRGWSIIQPIKLGEGWRLFVQSSAPLSVQLIGRTEG